MVQCNAAPLCDSSSDVSCPDITSLMMKYLERCDSCADKQECQLEGEKLLQHRLTKVVMRADFNLKWDTADTFFQNDNTENVTKKISPASLCPWGYEKEHDANRYPQYIHQAKCKSSTCTGYSGDKTCKCTKISYLMPVLKRQSCNPATGIQSWNPVNIEVSTACVPILLNE